MEIEDWLTILNEAVNAGILENLGDGIYKIHPALPWYLRQQLSQNYNVQEVSELEKKLLLLYLTVAAAHDIQDRGNAEKATTVLLIEEPNLLQYLRFAEQQQNWSAASVILKAVGQVYDLRGFWAEFCSLRQRALSQVGITLAEAKLKGKKAFEFWMYLRGCDATQALRLGDSEKARATHQEILDELISLNEPSLNNEIAAANFNLGMVAAYSRDFNAAFRYYQNALRIFESSKELSKADHISNIYYGLGVVAREQCNFQIATNYFQKSLQIYQNTGNLYRVAGIYHQLGSIARFQSNFAKAIIYYKEALKTNEDFGDYYHAAACYHELGQVAKE